jgi:hypothetical protein
MAKLKNVKSGKEPAFKEMRALERAETRNAEKFEKLQSEKELKFNMVCKTCGFIPAETSGAIHLVGILKKQNVLINSLRIYVPELSQMANEAEVLSALASLLSKTQSGKV